MRTIEMVPVYALTGWVMALLLTASGRTTRAHRIINNYTLAFLDRYLNGSPAALVDEVTPSPYPEVTVARRNIASARRAAK